MSGGSNPTPLIPAAQQAFLYGTSGTPASSTSGASTGPYSFGDIFKQISKAGMPGYTPADTTAAGTAASTTASTGAEPGILEAGPVGIGKLEDIASGVDFQKLYKAIVDASQRQTEEGRANIAEWAGASGVRYSGPMNQAMVDYESQVAKDRLATLEDLGFKATGYELSAASALSELLGQAGLAYKGATPSSAGAITQGIGEILLAIATAGASRAA